MKTFIWLDDKYKSVNRLNRNYYFVVTVLIVLLNIIIYAVCGSDTKYFGERPNWGHFSVANLFQALVNSYTHSNWQHCLLNMLCFFVAGLYLERKQGSVKFILFMIVMSLFTAFAVSANDISLGWQGFSGVNFGLYGYIIIEFIFVLDDKNSRYLFNVVHGAIVIALIYFAMCFNGGTSKVSFAWYPYDLLHNLGHASGFVVGIVFGLYEQIRNEISRFKSKNSNSDDQNA